MDAEVVGDGNSQRQKASSMLLWSRLSEIEGLQRKLTKMEDLLVELVELQQDIAAFVGENLSEAVTTAMEGTELRQHVGIPFLEHFTAVATSPCLPGDANVCYGSCLGLWLLNAP
ncbi:hypothetical protein PI126_g11198 [Phytophthora idaei]|nr:hypothetical protein PI126_g11198 [Phytophthora idaei]